MTGRSAGRPTTGSALGPADAEGLLDRLVAAHRPGFGLAREFSTDPGIYRLDLERIWWRSWLFAGHGCEIPRPGDYLVLDVDAASLIVDRGDDGRVRALHNTCRHRGMRLCDEPAGHARLLVCPYHQWAYDRAGALVACGGMDRDDGVDRAAFGLRAAHAREVGGLVYVCLAGDPPPFEPAAADLEPMLRPQGLARAKVAATRDYVVRANWKLVWENNRECWHCDVNHPQYVKANFDNAPIDDPRLRGEIEALSAAASARLAAHGLRIDYREAGMVRFPSADCWWAINRTPLAPGWVSESMDGRPVAPLMGAYPAHDVGTLRMRTMPNFWNHSSADHSVSTRLAPAGPDRTRIRVQWLVHEDAVEGADYRLDGLLPFWELTSEQDWALCERNQAGVASPAFTPGPYSSRREYNVIRYVEWYLAAVTGRVTESSSSARGSGDDTPPGLG
jgi:Rieske 2Fe-2S family protein